MAKTKQTTKSAAKASGAFEPTAAASAAAQPQATAKTIELGANRTGTQMSPRNAQEMQAGLDTPLAEPSCAGDASAIAELRSSYIAAADPVGSIPPPLNIKGAVKTGATMLTGKRPQVLVDKLGERLAFERSGTRLYEALITKCRADGNGGPIALDLLQQFCREEAEHFQLVAECIEQLGCDTTAQTPGADIAAVESQGLLQVITDPRTSVQQSLHAILAAELVDNAAWEELVMLASAHGQEDMARRFSEAMDQEQIHLDTIREWHQRMTLAEANVAEPT